MQKYIATIERKHKYVAEEIVEANSPEEAMEVARQKFALSENMQYIGADTEENVYEHTTLEDMLKSLEETD